MYDVCVYPSSIVTFSSIVTLRVCVSTGSDCFVWLRVRRVRCTWYGFSLKNFALAITHIVHRLELVLVRALALAYAFREPLIKGGVGYDREGVKAERSGRRKSPPAPAPPN